MWRRRGGGGEGRGGAEARRPGLIGRPVYKRCPAGAVGLFAEAGELRGAGGRLWSRPSGAVRSCPRRDAARQPRLHQVLARLRGAWQRRRPRERPAAAATAAVAGPPAPAVSLPLPPRRPRPPGAGASGLQRRPLPLLPSSGKGRLRSVGGVRGSARPLPAFVAGVGRR